MRIPSGALLSLALLLGCSGKDDVADDESSTAESTGASTGGGTTTDGGTSTTSGSTTAVCPVPDIAICEAPMLCPIIEVDDRPAPDVYAESEICGFMALRDRTPGLLRYNDCGGSSCSGADFLILADGRVFGDFASFDAEFGTSSDGPPIPCDLEAPAYFEACLAAFDASCKWSQFSVQCHHAESICECP